MLGIIFGMTPICERFAVIRLPRDAFQTTRLIWSFNFVIHLHLVVILAHRGQLVRCWIVDFTGPPSSRMRGGFAHMWVVSESERSHVVVWGLWCLGYKFHGPFPGFFWFHLDLVVDYVSNWGWKLKPPELTMLELQHFNIFYQNALSYLKKQN